ncbi:MAG: DEAD/DEAH box helicase [Actinomycetaceae bacterium]|nr:DEAD/DEAH box helicase [Actinomycetaceae bacterium]
MSQARDCRSPQVADAALRALKSAARGSDRLINTLTLPGREGECAPWPSWAHPQVVECYRTQGVEQPWKHQVEAATAIYENWHTVLATGTGSGKSLAAWLPILSAVAAHRDRSLAAVRNRPTAIYLSPTKALAADQYHALTHLLETGDELGIRIGTVDGDTPREAKDWARASADIILTNPDYLHHVLLPGNERWTRLLGSLRFLVIDEMHYWRGVMGAHVALVVRRLLRLARKYGAEPTVVCLSATVKDPAKVAARLIGVDDEDVVEVGADTSPAGPRTLVLWQPAYAAPEEVDVHEFLQALEAEGTKVVTTALERRAATSEAAALTAQVVQTGARALTFVRSRAAAEAVAGYARDQLSRDYSPYSAGVYAYRGGYLPEERRALEAAMRSGDLRALATTNALELGVDISGLDVTITAGWPGTRASFWQQVGRAGRAGAEGVSILVASDNPMDQYLVHHPEQIFSQVEENTFDPTNPYVLSPHLCAAAAETALTTADFPLFNIDRSFVDALVEMGYLRARPSGWYWNVTLPMRASDLTNLRGSSGQVQIVEGSTGTVIGTVGASDADAQVFPGAIYLHQGRTYQVMELTREPADGAGAGAGHAGVGAGAGAGNAAAGHAGADVSSPRAGGRSGGQGGAQIAVVERITTRLRTRPTIQSTVRILAEQDSWASDDGVVTWRVGQVHVESQVTDFDTLRLPGMVFVANTALAMPRHQLQTVAVWWEVSEAALLERGLSADEIPGALHAAEHASIAMLPLLATCDRWDLGGLSSADHPDTLKPTVFVHDGYPGGAGFAKHGFDHARRWVELTLEAVQSCPCEDGCPGCVQSPKCGNRNEPLSKAGATAVLEMLLQRTPPTN